MCRPHVKNVLTPERVKICESLRSVCVFRVRYQLYTFYMLYSSKPGLKSPCHDVHGSKTVLI